MTGVEAVSNGVQAFKDPVVDSARRTLTLIVAILIFLLLGIAYLVSAYRITATDPGSPGYQSILSMLTEAIVGRGIFYYVTIAAILLVLCLSANTSFADFPRVCRTVSQDGFLPHRLKHCKEGHDAHRGPQPRAGRQAGPPRLTALARQPHLGDSPALQSSPTGPEGRTPRAQFSSSARTRCRRTQSSRVPRGLGDFEPRTHLSTLRPRGTRHDFSIPAWAATPMGF